MPTSKELKKQIHELRKLKLQLQAGTEERIKLHREIQRLKSELTEVKIVSEKKKILIEKILKIKNYHIDLERFSEEELEKHLQKLSGVK